MPNISLCLWSITWVVTVPCCSRYLPCQHITWVVTFPLLLTLPPQPAHYQHRASAQYPPMLVLNYPDTRLSPLSLTLPGQRLTSSADVRVRAAVLLAICITNVSVGAALYKLVTHDPWGRSFFTVYSILMNLPGKMRSGSHGARMMPPPLLPYCFTQLPLLLHSADH